MNQALSRIIRLVTLITLLGLIAATLGFTYLKLQRSQTLDETLVSNLTTQLDTRAIDQAVTKISQ